MRKKDSPERIIDYNLKYNEIVCSKMKEFSGLLWDTCNYLAYILLCCVENYRAYKWRSAYKLIIQHIALLLNGKCTWFCDFGVSLIYNFIIHRG